MWPFTPIFFLFLFLSVKNKWSTIEWHALCCQREFWWIQWHPTREKTFVLMVDRSFDDVWITVYIQNWFATSDPNIFTGIQFLRWLHLYFIRMCIQCIYVQMFFNVSRTCILYHCRKVWCQDYNLVKFNKIQQFCSHWQL